MTHSRTLLCGAGVCGTLSSTRLAEVSAISPGRPSEADTDAGTKAFAHGFMADPSSLGVSVPVCEFETTASDNSEVEGTPGVDSISVAQGTGRAGSDTVLNADDTGATAGGD